MKLYNDYAKFMYEAVYKIKQGTGLNPKTAGGQFDGPGGLSKNISSIERVITWFFVTCNIVIRQIFPENFI